MTTTYHMWKDHTLLYKKSGNTLYGVLASDPFKGGADPKNGMAAPNEDELRLATIDDFNRFRVDPKGHLLGDDDAPEQGGDDTYDVEKDVQFKGYHKFPDNYDGEYGSFEVFNIDEQVAYELNYNRTGPDITPIKTGWYWHAAFPGCIPDGEPTGPFPTAEGAYLDAIGD